MKRRCSVSLDLDDQWTYLKTHGDPGWETAPSYLSVVVPRVLDLLDTLDLKITWFVVGRDAENPAHAQTLRAIPARGHEVGNHSTRHEPWLDRYTDAELVEEIIGAEAAIESATGVRPTGFRGPGFSFSPQLLTLLAARGYRYDASTFPTFLGPLARLYYFAQSRNLSAEDRAKRGKLFGTLADGLRPLTPYRWDTAAGPLLELPVSTMALLRAPVHLSYLLYLDGFSRRLAWAYFRLTLALWDAAKVEPSFLLHPLDFLGRDDTDRLAFFPGMRRDSAPKVAFSRLVLAELVRRYDAGPMGGHADAALARPLSVRRASP